MRNLIYRCGQAGHFFLNLSTFFQFSKKRKGTPLPSPYLSACLPYNKEKKKKNANGNVYLKETGTVPVTNREKHSLK